ncbi:MAG TPA: OB-fold nucleic acid binding domain-containing protein [Mycobacteriales bacterium]|nr:OB-fold nucleic acid binding domain-containing protein [Mycobacteriales bacterium]
MSDKGARGEDQRDRERGRLRKAVSRLGAEDDVLEAHDLQKESASHGATAVTECQNRKQVTVMGTVRSLTLRPRAGAPTLEVDLYDGSGTVTLVWLGRREVAGITPGRRLRATGRITTSGDRRVIFNPRYELILSAG